MQRDEDLMKVVKDVGMTVVMPIQEDEFGICYGVPDPSNDARNDVVQFVHRTKRNKLMEKVTQAYHVHLP